MTVDDNPANVTACLCPGCPTYDSCAADADENLYCSRGKSDCSLGENGCICDECSVWETYGLTDMYFCRNGAA